MEADHNGAATPENKVADSGIAAGNRRAEHEETGKIIFWKNKGTIRK